MLFEKKFYFMPARVKFGSVPKRFGTKFTIYSIMISESRLFSPGIRAGAIYVQYCSGPLPVTRYTLTKLHSQSLQNKPPLENVLVASHTAGSLTENIHADPGSGLLLADLHHERVIKVGTEPRIKDLLISSASFLLENASTSILEASYRYVRKPAKLYIALTCFHCF